MSSDLIERLRTISTHDDHSRGCQGREYSCTCGYDDRWAALTTEAADEIERLTARKVVGPSREAIARELHRRFYIVVTGHDDCLDWEEMPELLRDGYLDGADAIIALLETKAVEGEGEP